MAEAESIYALMSRAIREVPSVGKNSQAPTNMGGYKFRGIEDILAAIKPVIGRLGIFVVPTTLERIESERTLSGGKVQYVVDLHVRFTWYGPTGDSIEADVWGEGSDMGDKATQKAMTAAYKSMLQETFCIGDSAEDSEAHEVPPSEGTRRTTAQPPPAASPAPAPAKTAGWENAAEEAESHKTVNAQWATLKKALGDSPQNLTEQGNEVRAYIKDKGWPMSRDDLSGLVVLIARHQTPQDRPTEPPAPEAHPEPVAAQDGAPTGQSGDPAVCPWCEHPAGTNGAAVMVPTEADPAVKMAWCSGCRMEHSVEGDQPDRPPPTGVAAARAALGGGS